MNIEMDLLQLTDGLEYKIICGSNETKIQSVIYDSRKVTSGSLFVCIQGFVSDGHKYIKQALQKGAAAIMIADGQTGIELTELCKEAKEKHAVILSTPNTRRALAMISAAFFSYPSEKIQMIGITGTKGKTTTTYMIREIFQKSERSTGLIGTIANIIDGEVRQAERTTPESYDLQNLLSEMLEKNMDSCVMEVSSQGLMLDRSYGCRYQIGGFTNLYHDHIGEHEHANMQEYLDAKLLLFDQSAIGVINADSDVSDKVVEYASARCPVFTYGIDHECDVRAYDIKKEKKNGRIGTSFLVKSPWYNESFFVAMPGRFNVYNALCAISIAGICGIPAESVKAGLEDISVPGRLQRVPNKSAYTVLVDYAHNAASLENLLLTLREYCSGRLITVFGCGGDRAKSRRYEMGEVSGKLSDLSIITSDNPRSEEPMDIIADILYGFSKTNGKYLLEPDRENAISLALSLAQKDDFVIIAGKGHENYQIFKDHTIHFDDAEIAFKLLSDMDNCKTDEENT